MTTATIPPLRRADDFDLFVRLYDLTAHYCQRHVTKRRRNNLVSAAHKRRQAIFARDLHRCLCCGTPYDLTIDHVIPISRGGNSHPDNLQTLCFTCNQTKGTDIIDYRGIYPEAIIPEVAP